MPSNFSTGHPKTALLFRFFLVVLCVVCLLSYSRTSVITMKVCSRQGQFELMSVNQCTRTEGKVESSFQFSLIRRYIVCSH